MRATALLAALLCACPARAFLGLGGGNAPSDDPNRALSTYNTVTVRTAYALELLLGSFDSASEVRTEEVPLGSSGGKATLYQVLPSEVVVVFSDPSLSSDSWATSTAPVPFLKPFVYTSQAPAALLDAWAPLNTISGGEASTAGALKNAIDDFMDGEEVLRVICIGNGTAGGLALLCGPWAALAFPLANVDVFTFAAPYVGFNDQFAWSFEQLVVLSYTWPFPAPSVNETGVLPAARAVNPLITKDVLPEAVRLPNKPDWAPKDMQDPGNKTFEEVFESFMPPADLPEEYQLPESECPVMFCKTRPLLKGSCLGFDNETLFDGLPFAVLKDDRTDADAIVLWDNSTKTAHFLWKYTEEARDWFTDANGIQTEGFIKECENLQPGGVTTSNADSLTKLTGEVEVHTGFFNQFRSLALNPDRPEDNILLQLSLISEGQIPQRVTCSGFSLGGALSELCGVWASIQWPGVDVLVANQGGPIPGNEEFKLAFEATVGRAYKYVYRQDLVPSTAPFPWYKRVPASIWMNDTVALLQDRPLWSIGDLSWDEHTCDVWTNTKASPPYTIVGYVPHLYNITRPTVPGWVFNLGGAAPAPPPTNVTSAGGRAAAASVALAAATALPLLFLL